MIFHVTNMLNDLWDMTCWRTDIFCFFGHPEVYTYFDSAGVENYPSPLWVQFMYTEFKTRCLNMHGSHSVWRNMETVHLLIISFWRVQLEPTKKRYGKVFEATLLMLWLLIHCRFSVLIGCVQISMGFWDHSIPVLARYGSMGRGVCVAL